MQPTTYQVDASLILKIRLKEVMDLFIVEQPVNHTLGTQLQAPLISQTHTVQCIMLPLKE